ncbi:heterokaryon incompatibility protein-domain-containing protein [Podospora conica]|nr:heterokaryon incompatibility protein-domain-containing protein [Schizothecium conicum]
MAQGSRNSATQNIYTDGDAVIALADIRNLNQNTSPVLTPGQLYATLPLSASDRSIRLLDLDAAADDTPLSGCLRVASLASSPRFAALSYVWGGYTEPRDTISCNGNSCAIDITSNCRDALLALRQRYGAITVWVDAICINQDDDTEKVVQIELMNEIYTWAHTTLIWLGQGDALSDSALTWLAKNARGVIITDILQFGSAPSQAGRVKAWCKILASIITDPFEQGVAWLRLGRAIWGDANTHWIDKLFWKGRIRPGFNIPALDSLFFRPWFQRAWTFQEYILSTNQIFLCGNKAISGDNLIGGLEALFKGFEGTAVMPKIPRSVFSMRDLAVAWMNVSRVTQWNDQKPVRRPLPLTTLRAYQQTALSSLLEPATILAVWTSYVLTLAALGFFVIFSVVILLGIIPAVLRREIPQLLTASWITPMSFVGMGLAAAILTLMAYGLTYILSDTHRQKSSLRRDNHRFPDTCRQPGFTLPPASSKTAPRKQEDSSSIEDGLSKPQGTKAKDSETVHLAAILHALRERGATNPRDRSFALHGVLSRLEGFRLTSVDYSLSCTRIYQALVADLIRWRPDMTNLLLDAGWSRTGMVEEDDPAPSWVPDWDIVSKKQSIRQNPGLFAPDRYYRPHEQSFATDGWPIRAEVDGDRLRVAGVWVGRVGFSTGKFFYMAGVTDLVTSAEDRRAKVQTMAADPLLAKQTVVLAVWVLYCRRNATLAYESVPDAMNTVLRGPALSTSGRQRAAEERNSFYTVYQALIAVEPEVLDRAAAGEADEAQMRVRELFEESENNQRLLNLALRYVNDYLAERRALFVTDRGHIGTGATDARVGDRLALIAGVSVPMVLREKHRGGGEYVVVGPAFVPGFMESGDVGMMSTEMITLV